MFRPIAAACDRCRVPIIDPGVQLLHNSCIFSFLPPCSYFDDETWVSIIAGSVFVF